MIVTFVSYRIVCNNKPLFSHKIAKSYLNKNSNIFTYELAVN